jgi:site-specific recombinase XerD
MTVSPEWRKPPMPKRRVDAPKYERGIFVKPEAPKVFWIAYKDGFGKYRREKCGTYATASTRLTIVRAQALKDRRIPAEFRPAGDIVRPTIADIVETGLAYSKEHKKKSYKYDRLYKPVIVRLFGERIADDITGRELESGLERHAHAANWAGATFNRYKAFLSMCYKAAYYAEKECDRVSTNPAKMIRGKRETKVDRCLTRGDGSEYERLLAVIAKDYPQHLQRFNFALATGMRWSSQHSATYEMLDEQNKMIRLPDSKSGKPLHLPLNAHALDAIRASASYAEKKGLIFPSAHGSKQVRSCSEWFDKAVKKAGITERLTWHSATRHTFCSWLVQDGVSLHRVGKLAGHSDMHTTDRYAHYSQDNMVEDIARFNPAKGTTSAAYVAPMSRDEQVEMQHTQSKAVGA